MDEEKIISETIETALSDAANDSAAEDLISEIAGPEDIPAEAPGSEEGISVLTDPEIETSVEPVEETAEEADSEPEESEAAAAPEEEPATAEETVAEVDVAEDTPSDEAESPADKPEDKAEAKPKKKAPSKKKPMSKRMSTILVLLELALLVVCVFVFLRSVSFNKDDDLVYADPKQEDEITCSDGRLHVNNVSADVPTEGNVSYNISYTWGAEDTDYPSVPRAATASYRNDDDKLLYDISLYRDSFTPDAKVPDDKDVDTWFDSWESLDTEVSTQQPKDAGDLHGFLITSNEDLKNEDSGSIYTSSAFYFAVQDEDGISVYVLEGILYDPAGLEAYESALSASMESITIKEIEAEEAGTGEE